MKNKIILDTNLWISFLISKNFKQLDKLIEDKKVTLIFSNELIEEFIDVVSRPKFKNFISKKDIEKILEYFDEFGEMVSVQSNINLCRDEKDNFLLNLALDSKANYLITGDKDLLDLKNIDKTKITTFSDFIGSID
jgi:putative PIN family toxin of toxin-antitoxin system